MNPAERRQRLYWDIFVTAVEGGIGYWSEAEDYHIWLPDGGEDLTGFGVTLHIDDVNEEDRIKTVYAGVIDVGYRRAVAAPWRTGLAWSSEAPPLIVKNETEWDFDSGDADMILQLGLFNEVMFG